MTNTLTERLQRSRYDSQRYHAQQAGAWAPFVDAAPVRAHLVELAGAGIGHRRAAELAGVTFMTAREIRAGRRLRVRSETAAALLAVPVAPVAKTPWTVDATGTQRRIGARAAMGWSLESQAKEVGCERTNFGRILRRPRVAVRTARKVAATYERMCMQPAPDSPAARWTRLWAERRGYVSPLAWDDDTIDDPTAGPYGVPARDPDEIDSVRIRHVCAGKPAAGLTRAERHAVAVALVATGLTVKETGRRVHLDRRTIHKLLKVGAS